ncbi:MAG: hypothetical protein ACI97N_001898 [Cognaticolwellia sp.]|jgi:hypothetical protein
MKLFRNLRLRWHDYMLNQKIKSLSVKRTSIHFEKSKRIGILFDATNLDNRVFVENYMQLFRKAGKRVDIMAFVDDEEKHDNLPFKYFNRKDLSWYEHPKTQEVEEFINTPFDILINLHIHPVKSLEYIAALSHANMRVGKYDESKVHCYDLMIDNAKNENLQHFIQQIDKHLKILG